MLSVERWWEVGYKEIFVAHFLYYVDGHESREYDRHGTSGDYGLCCRDASH